MKNFPKYVLETIEEIDRKTTCLRYWIEGHKYATENKTHSVENLLNRLDTDKSEAWLQGFNDGMKTKPKYTA